MFRNFIQRPVLAIVISVLILFVGGLAMKQLPTAQFPEIAPTTVNIFIAYPGASADVLTKSTIIQLETAINGVQDMRYIASDATSAGEGTIRVIFEPGKCISCGICVEIAAKERVPLGLTFIGRGFDLKVSVPPSAGLTQALDRVADESVRHCPTGALAFEDDARQAAVREAGGHRAAT